MYLDMQKQNFVLGLRKGLHTGVFFPLKRKLEMLRQSSLQWSLKCRCFQIIQGIYANCTDKESDYFGSLTKNIKRSELT